MVLFCTTKSKTKENANEAPRQDIMVDGLCPKKSIFPSEPMFKNTAYRAGGAPGVNSGDYPDCGKKGTSIKS